MKSFPGFSEERRRLFCEQAQDKLRLPPASIEKDIALCISLGFFRQVLVSSADGEN